MNIMIVDDEIVIVNSLKRRGEWKKHGIENVFTATSAVAAREILGKQRVDIMLCDIEMPEENGLELFRWVKNKYPDIECVYVTCHPEFAYAQEAIKLGSADYLLKPVDYQELDSVLASIISRINENQRHRERAEYGDLWLNDRCKEAVPNESDPVEAVKSYIKKNLNMVPAVSDLAQTVHLNPQYLMRLFKKQTGLSINEYIAKTKMDVAKKMLCESEASVSHISETLGYSNYTYFTTLFKKHEGITPGEYRAQALGGINE